MHMNRLFLAAALAGLGLSGPAQAASGPAKTHMIVAAEPDAAKAGLDMLRAGGSAVDAAIAAQLVLTLEEPQASGIGGGAYMVLADGAVVRAYDGRETAPASASPTMFLNANRQPRGFGDVQYGGLPVGVPGVLAMLASAHKEHGRLPWARLFEPAVALAEKGFAVTPRLALELEQFKNALSALPDMRGYFFHADGTPLKAGETLKNPTLAASFRELAAKGADTFYKGAMADTIAAAVTRAPVNPVAFTRADLGNYKPLERAALCGVYRRYRICGVPPSSSGGVTVLQILALVGHFPSADLKTQNPRAIHLISEAERLAYADRGRWLGDPDFVPLPMPGLLDRAYVEGRAKLIDPMRAMGMATAGTPPLPKAGRNFAPMPNQPSFGTSHIAVVDDRGEALSMTTSVQAAFGAGILAGGFILNNQLTDFSFAPEVNSMAVANAAAPGKRPLSSMSPVVVYGPDGKFFAALGSPGGRQIIGYVAEALIALIDGQTSMAEAAARPRHINMNGPTILEQGTALGDIAAALTGFGHDVRMDAFDSGVNGIRRIPGGYEGGADPRREGIALGD